MKAHSLPYKRELPAWRDYLELTKPKVVALILLTHKVLERQMNRAIRLVAFEQIQRLATTRHTFPRNTAKVESRTAHRGTPTS